MKTDKRVLVIVAAISLAACGSALAKKRPVQERYTATMSPALSSNNEVDIAIEEYSAAEDVKGYAEVYAKEGEDGLEKAMNKAKKGYFRMMEAETTPLLVVESSQQGTGRRLQIVAQAPDTLGPGIMKVGHGGYPFSFMQLDVDQQGNGTGVLIVFAKLTFDPEGRMVIKSMNKGGSRLVNVRLEK